MKIITTTGDERPVVIVDIVDYQSDVYANDALTLANAKLNFNNSATVNVAVTANGNTYANVSFSVNTSAVGGGGGNYGADVFVGGTSLVANANINFVNTSSVNVSAVANGSTRANVGFTVAAASNTGTAGISALDSSITSVSNTVAATAYSANVASQVPVLVMGSSVGAQRNINFVSANTSNLNVTGTVNSTGGNVTVTFDTRLNPSSTDAAAANLVAIYANNGLIMANANVNFNNSSMINVAVTANAANKRANVEFTLNDNQRAEELVITFDGGGQVLTTGDSNTYYTIPYAGTIDSWYVTGSPSGNVVIDVWKRAGAIPVNANTITGTEKPTLNSAQLANDTALSSWTTSVARGDVFGFEVESVSLVTRATLVLRILRS